MMQGALHNIRIGFEASRRASARSFDFDDDLSFEESAPSQNICGGLADWVGFDDFEPSGDSFKDTPDTRLIKYTSGLRVQWELEPGQDHIITNPTNPSASIPQIFITFGNHLGSTSAVVDYQTGDLVEWKTNYAYGADESHWKNEDEKYDNAEEPYGFTGKEEDQAVGLHYLPLTNGRPVCLFCTPSSSWTSYTKDGARYYSSYIGRWLSPDPVPMHGGAFTNYYNYGCNSPYIYVDPDGRWAHILAAAIVGSVVGSVKETIKRKGIHNVKDLFWVVVAGVRGGAIGAASAVNPLLGAAVATSDAQLEMLINGGDPTKGEFHKQSLIVLGSSVGSGYAGQAVGAATSGMNAISGEVVRAGSSWGLSTLTAMTNQAVWTDEGLTDENWDNVFAEASINFAISYGASQGGRALGSSSTSYSHTGKDGNTYNYRELNSQETKMHQKSLGRVQALEGDYAPVKNIGDVPVYRLQPGSAADFQTSNTMVNINGQDTILLGSNAFKNSDNFTHGLLSEFQHTKSGFGLSDRDFVGPNMFEGDSIAQMQVNHMAKELGMDPSKMPLHGQGLPASENAPVPSSPVQAYRRDGVLYHNLSGRVYDSQAG